MSNNAVIRKGYSDSPVGQLHWRMSEPVDGKTIYPDLFCLHPAPFSGVAFTSIMPFLAKGRRVIAPDYPGHGGSDRFTSSPSISDYADAINAVMNDLSQDGMIDVMGFHTGCLVAAELALLSADHIRRLVFVDAPAFDASTRQKFLPGAGAPLELTADILCLSKLWEGVMVKRLDSQGPDRSFEMFVEQLRHGRDMNAAFHAAFTYKVEERFPEISKPCLVIASQSGLLDATRRAARLIPGAQLIERLDIKRAVVDEAADLTAHEILTFLDKGGNAHC